MLMRTRGDELEILMDGGTIEKPVHEDITYGDIHAKHGQFLELPVFHGISQRREAACTDGGNCLSGDLSIPNTGSQRRSTDGLSEAWFDEKI